MKVSRVCLDLTPLEMRDRHGGFRRYGLYLWEQLCALPADAREGMELWAMLRSSRPPQPAGEVDPAEVLAAPEVPPGRHRTQRRLLMGGLLRRAGVHLLHALHSGSLPLLSGLRVVATAHDIIPIVLPEPGGGLRKAAGRVADRVETGVRHHRPHHLISVSESTAADLVRVLRVPRERITVVPLGVDRRRFSPVEASPGADRQVTGGLDLPGRYFISVGSDHYRKNQLALLRAWLEVADRMSEGLVLVGKAMYDGTLDEVARMVRQAGVEGRFRWLQGITDQQLPALYRGATAMVTPSLYEGFGMTLLEAMACGAPVAASRVSSHPEVGGDAALFFDPRSSQDLGGVLLRLAGDRVEQERLRRAGLERAARFSWERCAAGTAAVYRAQLGL